MAVALVVLLGTLSSLLIGSRIAERRIVEERLARIQIENVMAGNCTAGTDQSQPVDKVKYTIVTTCTTPSPGGYVEITVTVQDPSGARLSLTNDKVTPSPSVTPTSS
jgi:hypothetical protein